MSKVASRTTTGTTTTSNSQRRAPYATTASRALPPSAGQAPTYNTRRVTGNGLDYRIEEKIGKDGTRTEVITIEDTPPSHVGPSGSGSTYSRYDSNSAFEPAPKKRKSDGAFISDQPYASTSGASASHYGAASTVHSNGYAKPLAASGSSVSKNKRKLDAYDGYANVRDTGTGKEKVKEEPSRDKEGHFIVRVHDTIGPEHRYQITRSLGQGTFGKVVAAVDLVTKKEVAVKVIRAVPKYREASKVEVKVLSLLKRHDPDNKNKCIHLLATFDHKDHVCLVSELLSSSVFDFLKANSYQPFPFSHIQKFAKQLLESVKFLHGLRLIHTDLKPENILLEDVASREVTFKRKPKKVLNNANIRLIDFGSATFESEYHATVVSTRHYRAPEIILGTGWSYPCDVWSIGCILIEFYTGEALFQTHENVEHLAMMEKVFGPMPDSLVTKCIAKRDTPQAEWFKNTQNSKSRKRGESGWVLDFPPKNATKQSIKYVRGMKALDEIIKSDEVAAVRFRDLLSKLLQWEPNKRITVAEALKDPFFQVVIRDEASDLSP